MLTCLPKSLCNWNFRVPDTSAGTAELNFNFLTEQGDIQFSGQAFEVRKHGWTSGHWTLESNHGVLIDGQKVSPFLRTFVIQAHDRSFTLKAQSAFGRSFDVLESDRVQGTIRPVHPFTRRTVLDCSDEVPELVQLFCFWLVALMWRRSQKNNSS